MSAMLSATCRDRITAFTATASTCKRGSMKRSSSRRSVAAAGRPASGRTLVAPAAGGTLLNPMLATIRHQRLPAGLRGACSAGSRPSQWGAAARDGPGGAAVNAIGLAPTVLLLGACSHLVRVGLLVVPALHRRDRPDCSG